MKHSRSHICVENLYFSREGRQIFSGFSAEFPRGKISAVMGLSGAGKTTLLKLIGAQLRPQSGQILFDGHDMHALGVKALYRERRKMGILFQSGALLTDFSVFENVAFPLREHTSMSEPLLRHMVEIKLNAVGLTGAAHLYPSELSGGMLRRVALARALILDPSVVMYDEPFTGQDPITKGVTVRLIRDLNQLLNLTSIVVSHDIQETCDIADEVFIINDGKVVCSGTPQDVLASTQPWVRQFMHARATGPVRFDYSAHPLSPGAAEAESVECKTP